MLPNKRLPIALHILAWTIIVIIPHYLIYTFGDGNRRFLNHLYINLAIYGSLFYLNYLWMVPQLFLRGHKVKYFFVAVGIIMIVCAAMWYINEYLFLNKAHEQQIKELIEEVDKNQKILKPPIKQFRIVNYFSTSVLILGFSFGLKLVEKVGKDEKKRKELEREKLNSELAFLKNQISPHFFFNTLNNIYSLIAIDTSEAQESVLKLSKLMRYLLYESEHGETKLSEEISFMNHYIDLMKLRLSEKVQLTVSFPENNADVKVPPLLFIPFVENSFKHGISYREPSFIQIKMEIEENKIFFETRNSKGRSSSANDGQYSGIGLENVKKRLNLLFPKSHQLVINDTTEEFSVKLTIEMNRINA